MKTRYPILNPDHDWSAKAAFDPDRLLPREIIDPYVQVIPWGEHPDDDWFLICEVDQDGTTTTRTLHERGYLG